MEKKKVEKTTVLMVSLQTSLSTLVTDMKDYPSQMMMKAEELGLEITGPQIWNYFGVDGKPETRFNLDICIPISAVNGNPGQFKFDVLPEVTCITELHKGAWAELGNTYQRVFGEMGRKGLVPTGANREIYLQCDFENQENNLTEVQVVVHQ